MNLVLLVYLTSVMATLDNFRKKSEEYGPNEVFLSEALIETLEWKDGEPVGINPLFKWAEEDSSRYITCIFYPYLVEQADFDDAPVIESYNYDVISTYPAIFKILQEHTKYYQTIRSQEPEFFIRVGDEDSIGNDIKRYDETRHLYISNIIIILRELILYTQPFYYVGDYIDQLLPYLHLDQNVKEEIRRHLYKFIFKHIHLFAYNRVTETAKKYLGKLYNRSGGYIHFNYDNDDKYTSLDFRSTFYPELLAKTATEFKSLFDRVEYMRGEKFNDELIKTYHITPLLFS